MSVELFGPYNLDAMNETDVREIIVRPLLGLLGYRQGTPANIETEKQLRYSRAVLGRKKETDPELRGKADYICDALSYGRWVVEVKAPSETLSQDHVHQAYTYAAHPEISALFILLTNGRHFRIYRVGKMDAPIFEWKIEETKTYLLNIKNVLGAEAIRRRLEVPIDYKKPLALNFGSRIKIVGGHLTYEEFNSDWQLLQGQFSKQNAAIVGGELVRGEDGAIRGHVEQAGPYGPLHFIEKAANVDVLQFSCNDEYVSSDKNSPTIMQNFVTWDVPAGIPIPREAFGGMKLALAALPFSVAAKALTEVIGFIDGNKIKGTFTVEFEYRFGNLSMPHLRQVLPERVRVTSAGNFEVVVQDLSSVN